MNFADCLKVLKQGSRVRRAEWTEAWLDQPTPTVINMISEGGRRVVTWTPRLADIVADDWSIIEGKPPTQTVQVPQNSFFGPMGGR
jgi:hypothetical protein